MAGGEGGCFIADVGAHSRSTFQACLGLQSLPGHMTVCENGNFTDFLDLLDTVDKLPISKTNEGPLHLGKAFLHINPNPYITLSLHILPILENYIIPMFFC